METTHTDKATKGSFNIGGRTMPSLFRLTTSFLTDVGGEEDKKN
jgi:hypothetical protein